MMAHSVTFYRPTKRPEPSRPKHLDWVLLALAIIVVLCLAALFGDDPAPFHPLDHPVQIIEFGAAHGATRDAWTALSPRGVSAHETRRVDRAEVADTPHAKFEVSAGGLAPSPQSAERALGEELASVRQPSALSVEVKSSYRKVRRIHWESYRARGGSQEDSRPAAYEAHG